MTEKIDTSYIVMKIGVRLFAFAALLLFFWNFSDFVAGYIIDTQLEWASPSSVGGMVFSIGMLVSSWFVDIVTERLYKKMSKDGGSSE